MTRLTNKERIWIGFWKRLGKSGREIADLVGREQSVVNRELRRNRDQFGYAPERAETYTARRAAAHSRTKLSKDPRLKAWVVERLEDDWSPEEVAGRLKNHPPSHLRGKAISMETIYQFVYSEEGRELGLWRHLRRSQPRRQPRAARRTRPTLISERTSIHDRPEEVNERTTPWHWESDSIVGPGQPALSVQEERLSRLTRLHKVANKTADETLVAIERTVDSVPHGTVATMTFDNGGEGAKHTELRSRYDIQTYCADPYCSWQKGSVENTNGLIRQYFPKKTNFATVTDEQVKFVEDRLNNRPRKRLDFLTPNERFTQLTGALAS